MATLVVSGTLDGTVTSSESEESKQTFFHALSLLKQLSRLLSPSEAVIRTTVTFKEEEFLLAIGDNNGPHELRVYRKELV